MDDKDAQILSEKCIQVSSLSLLTMNILIKEFQIDSTIAKSIISKIENKYSTIEDNGST